MNLSVMKTGRLVWRVLQWSKSRKRENVKFDCLLQGTEIIFEDFRSLVVKECMHSEEDEVRGKNNKTIKQKREI